ncbi:MAG: hypothetical protein RID09_27950 [Coleofasciculus sp. G1-WW12-02]|uniref:hypothetical protein n=1 Tax=Coleofasciculus sp. G1-WW12-02 TaxID=3068483 RepID=UPI0032F6D884
MPLKALIAKGLGVVQQALIKGKCDRVSYELVCLWIFGGVRGFGGMDFAIALFLTI